MLSWGVEIVQYLQDITVVNSAVSGTSARSYARDGWFYNVIHQVKAGDCTLTLAHSHLIRPLN